MFMQIIENIRSLSEVGLGISTMKNTQQELRKQFEKCKQAQRDQLSVLWNPGVVNNIC